MDAHKRTLGDILSPDTRLVAPLFQRPYVWDKDNNWEPLWQALQEVFSRYLTGDKVRPYFLGALVLDQCTTSTGSVPAREIIDGQQRLTTLQVVFKAASDLFTEFGLHYEAKQINKLAFNELEETSDQRFKVWPTNIDREHFRHVMTSGTADGLIGNAYSFFRECLKDWLCPEDDRLKARATAIVAGMKQGLIFIAIDLGNDDDGQLIFETLNALGTPLLPSDLVKNLLFREAIAACLDTDSLYEKYWKSFEDTDYWRTEIGVGRQKRYRLDIFLQYYLTLKSAEEVALPHLFRVYQDAFREKKMLGDDVEQALKDFSHYADVYRQFDEEKGTPGTQSLSRLLAVMQLNTPLPLIMGILTKANRTEGESMCQVIESYLARRMICGLTLKNLNKLTVELIARLSKEGWTKKNLRDALIDQQAYTTKWIDDDQVHQSVTTKSTYNSIRPNRIAYLLARAEIRLHSSKSEADGIHLLSEALSIEHLMPQKWQTHWPLPADATTDGAGLRNELLHHFGNLTILTQHLNIDVSNGAWETKREKLKTHSVLLMNSQLAALDTWNEDAISKRSVELADTFCTIWPR